jgi:hypothetical protein
MGPVEHLCTAAAIIVGGEMKQFACIFQFFLATFLQYFCFCTVASAQGPTLFVPPRPQTSIQLSTANQTTAQAVPDYVIYDFCFRRVVSYENRAQNAANESLASTYRAVITTELGITESQRVFLLNLSAQSIQAAAQLDKAAAGIISQVRSLYPDGKIPAGQSVPRPPQQLSDMQASRNAIFSQAKSQMLDFFGTEAFQQIDTRIRIGMIQNTTAPHP